VVRVTAAVRAALVTLRRCARGLALPDLDPTQRAALAELHDAALALLEAGADRRRLSTRALSERVRELDRALANRPPGERAAAVCARLRISRSRYYELRRDRDSE
jgi:hypothetical protein